MPPISRRGCSIRSVRQGKVFELDLMGSDRAEAEKIIPEIADKVLANPIIEQFQWSILDNDGEE